jgi:hypothetical protein
MGESHQMKKGDTIFIISRSGKHYKSFLKGFGTNEHINQTGLWVFHKKNSVLHPYTYFWTNSVKIKPCKMILCEKLLMV